VGSDAAAEGVFDLPVGEGTGVLTTADVEGCAAGSIVDGLRVEQSGIEMVVSDREAATQNHIAVIDGWRPGEADLRRVVAIVRVVEIVGRHQPHAGELGTGGAENGLADVAGLVAERCVDLITKTGVESESRRDLPVVLDVEGDVLGAEIKLGVGW